MHIYFLLVVGPYFYIHNIQSFKNLTVNNRILFQYFCGDERNNKDTIIRVEEPATCEYIITVHSGNLCKHPAFHVKEKTTKISLICSPLLAEEAYNKYMEKQKVRKELEEQKRKQG